MGTSVVRGDSNEDLDVRGDSNADLDARGTLMSILM